MLKKVKQIKLGKQIYRRLMKKVLERDEWRRQKCGSLENLQAHHKIKRSQLGNDSLDNLVTLCAYCHMGRTGSFSIQSQRSESAASQNPEGTEDPAGDEIRIWPTEDRSSWKEAGRGGLGCGMI